MKKHLVLLVLTIIVMAGSVVPTYADPSLDEPTVSDIDITADEYDVEEKHKEDVEKKLIKIFTSDITSEKGVNAGVKMAEPFVYIIHVFSIAIIVVVSYLFVGVTALDLAYIIVPPLRGVLMKKKESNGGMRGGTESGGFMCISDSCVAAVHGSGGSSGTGGVMGQGGNNDRGVGSSLVKYAGDRTKEFVVFILFVLFFLLGIMGRLAVVLFNLFTGLFEGLLNFI